MQIVHIKDEYIKLGQAMKLAGLVDEGFEAKLAIQEGRVQVNQEEELRRGRKLFHGDIIRFEGQDIQIISENA